MVEIEVTPEVLRVHVKGFDRFLTIKSHLEVPLDHVVGVEPGIDRATWEELRHSFRVGTVAGGFVAGTFRHHGEWMFWDLHDPARAITILLAHDRFKKVVVEVGDPEEAVARIRAALA